MSYNFTQSVKLERKLYLTGKIRYFCARQNPTDQRVLKAVNNCSAYGVLLCDLVCLQCGLVCLQCDLVCLQCDLVCLQCDLVCLHG
jgi:hypothetical protein